MDLFQKLCQRDVFFQYLLELLCAMRELIRVVWGSRLVRGEVSPFVLFRQLCSALCPVVTSCVTGELTGAAELLAAALPLQVRSRSLYLVSTSAGSIVGGFSCGGRT
jgi:hypothetical protein